MEGSSKPRRTAFAAPLTNALACLWGGAAAYILCYSFLVTRNMRFATAAFAALVAVWATLERKRWGRLALMGLGLTTVGAFAFLLGAYGAFGSHIQPQAQLLGNMLRSLALTYDISASAVAGLLLLAAVTAVWMLHPDVVAEYNHNKKPSLASAQRGIAVALVCCWAAAIALTPLQTAEKQTTPGSGHPMNAGPRRHSTLHHASHALSSLPVLSAAASRSR